MSQRKKLSKGEIEYLAWLKAKRENEGLGQESAT